MIFVAIQVEQTVDEIERTLAEGWVGMLGGLTDGGFGADEDFSVLEGDDIRGRGISEEIRVSAGDVGIGDEGDFYFLEVGQLRFVRARVGEDQRERVPGGLEETFHVQRENGLVIVEFQRGHGCRLTKRAGGCKSEHPQRSQKLRWQGAGTGALSATMKLLTILTSLLGSVAVAPADTTLPALATNALGLDLYRLESVQTKGNLLLSPYSIQSALGMTLGGADGETLTEMAKVLHWGTDTDGAARGFGELRGLLEKAAADSARMAEQAKKYDSKFEPLQLRVANRLFGTEDAKFERDFLERT